MSERQHQVTVGVAGWFVLILPQSARRQFEPVDGSSTSLDGQDEVRHYLEEVSDPQQGCVLTKAIRLSPEIRNLAN